MTHPQGHLKKFKEEVQDMGTKILQAALALHEKVSTTFRKTAINFHYEFSIRHMSNVFSGILMAQPEKFVEVRGLHACARACDRAVDFTVCVCVCVCAAGQVRHAVAARDGACVR